MQICLVDFGVGYENIYGIEKIELATYVMA